MKKPPKTEADVFDWFGALQRAIDEAAALREPTAPKPDPCLCGSTDIRGRIITEPVDLRDADVTCYRTEGQRACRACQHGISHGAMCVRRRYTATSTVRDHYHPECVRL